MPREKTSVSREDYLKAIWEMVQEEHEPISARLAEELGVTPPAVTAALKRMTRDGLLVVRRDGRIALTRKGSSLADHLAMRHQLAESCSPKSSASTGRAPTMKPSASNTESRPKSKNYCWRVLAPKVLPSRRAAAGRPRKVAAQTRRGPAIRCGNGEVGRSSLRLRERSGIPEVSLRTHIASRRARPHPQTRIRRDDDARGRQPHDPPRQASDQPHLGPRADFLTWKILGLNWVQGNSPTN